ncbi:MAG: hypothetical protein INR71_15580 [Terriglobus roseus]|nr:hypothetical protein [Terriglobus roseus]
MQATVKTEVKKEEEETKVPADLGAVKQEGEDAAAAPVVFKKRKAKVMKK